jgi:hypothetical protein
MSSAQGKPVRHELPHAPRCIPNAHRGSLREDPIRPRVSLEEAPIPLNRHRAFTFVSSRRPGLDCEPGQLTIPARDADARHPRGCSWCVVPLRAAIASIASCTETCTASERGSSLPMRSRMARICRGRTFLILCGRQVAEVTRNCETPDYPEIRVRSLQRPNPPSRPVGREGQSASRSDSPTIAETEGVLPPGCADRASVGGFRGSRG